MDLELDLVRLRLKHRLSRMILMKVWPIAWNYDTRHREALNAGLHSRHWGSSANFQTVDRPVWDALQRISNLMSGNFPRDLEQGTKLLSYSLRFAPASGISIIISGGGFHLCVSYMGQPYTSSERKMSQDSVARGTEIETSLMGIRSICIHADLIRAAIAGGQCHYYSVGVGRGRGSLGFLEWTALQPHTYPDLGTYAVFRLHVP